MEILKKLIYINIYKISQTIINYEPPLDNYDIVKIILNILKYDFNTLYNLLHVNNLIRTEILSNNTYPKLIDILIKYKISQLDNLIIDIKKIIKILLY